MFFFSKYEIWIVIVMGFWRFGILGLNDPNPTGARVDGVQLLKVLKVKPIKG